MPKYNSFYSYMSRNDDDPSKNRQIKIEKRMTAIIRSFKKKIATD